MSEEIKDIIEAEKEYNASQIQVLEGLEAGEKVIVSSYESYKDNEVLVLE